MGQCYVSGRLVTGLSVWRLRFDPRTAHMGFVVYKISLRENFLLVLCFPLANVFPAMVQSCISFTYSRRYIISTTGRAHQ
jgi:hypothetical protein